MINCLSKMKFIPVHTLNLVLLLVVFSGALNAQVTNKRYAEALQQAEEYFYDANYTDALSEYQKALAYDPDNLSIWKQVAQSHYYLNQIDEALVWYKKVDEKETSIDPDFILHYGQALMKSGKYFEARQQFFRYNDFLESDDPLVSLYLYSIENIDKYKDDSLFYSTEIYPLNTELADINPICYKDKLYHLVAFDNETAAYLQPTEMRASSPEDSTTYSEKKSQVVIKTNEGVVSAFVTSDGSLLYTDIEKKDETTQYALKQKGKGDKDAFARDAKSVNIDDFQFNVLNPVTNTDGSVLIFVSDVPGGFGGYDLYMVDRVGGKYGNIRNLGPRINTIGDELFPYILADSVLFFASTGHGGLGGFDINMTNLYDSKSKVMNMGYPINSSYDDYGICFYTDFEGYFASNREGGIGAEDIYGFLITNLRYRSVVKHANTGENMRNLSIDVSYTDGKREKMSLADNSNFSLTVKPGDEFEIAVEKEGYETSSVHVDTKDWKLTGGHTFASQTIEMTPTPETAEKEAQLLADKMEKAKTEPKETQIQKNIYELKRTDSGIRFYIQVAASKIKLSESSVKNLQKGYAEVSFIRSGEWYLYYIGEPYLSYFDANQERKKLDLEKSVIIAQKKDASIKLMDGIREAHVPANLAAITEKDIPAAQVADKVIMSYNSDNPYFQDHEKMNVYKLADAMKNNEDYRLEFISYTDPSGSNLYNKAISFERAWNLLEFFVDLGVSPNRVKVYPIGEDYTIDAGMDAGKLRRVEVRMVK